MLKSGCWKYTYAVRLSHTTFCSDACSLYLGLSVDHLTVHSHLMHLYPLLTLHLSMKPAYLMLFSCIPATY